MMPARPNHFVLVRDDPAMTHYQTSHHEVESFSTNYRNNSALNSILHALKMKGWVQTRTFVKTVCSFSCVRNLKMIEPVFAYKSIHFFVAKIFL